MYMMCSMDDLMRAEDVAKLATIVKVSGAKAD